MGSALRRIRRPEASDRLREHTEIILQEWKEQVLGEVPAASKLPDDDLFDTLPDLLAKLVEVISTRSGTTIGKQFSKETIEICRRHGEHRARRSEYTLDQVITEHRILRQVVLHNLEKDRPLSSQERMNLLEAFDNAMVQVATEFTSFLGFEKSRLYDEIQGQTKELEARLHYAQNKTKELQEERKLREQFVSMLTHDLRMPMTAVRASAELITKKPNEPAICHDFGIKIKEAIDRADRMIRDILDVSRIRAGEKLPLEITPCHLNSIVKHTLADLSTVYGDRFSLQENQTIEGYWDASEVRRILENLCTNAVKYGCPHSPIIIYLNQSSDIVHITVHNEGQGLTREEQTFLFQAYGRTPAAQVSGKKGWGIGLTLVQGAAEAHGGRVEVESNPNRGTSFTVKLPRDARHFRKSNLRVA